MSRCTDGSCCGKGLSDGPISLPGTFDHDLPWRFYNHLIDGIPKDVLVLDCCVGTGWTYLEAESGMGLSYTMTGGSRAAFGDSIIGLPLHNVAELAKSWNWREASIGVAALNAWYSTTEKVLALGGQLGSVGTGNSSMDVHASTTQGADSPKNLMNPFNSLRERYANKNVTVIGHFPDVDGMADICNLTVLERNPSGSDTPDPACEYVLPKQDFVFLTGVTVINKTAPRLLDLAKAATVVMLGPSVIASDFLFRWGIDILAGRVVEDAEKAKAAVKQGSPFSGALRMFQIEKS
jgi:uncharacterized protein (DUF4213/DUF364 family)